MNRALLFLLVLALFLGSAAAVKGGHSGGMRQLMGDDDDDKEVTGSAKESKETAKDPKESKKHKKKEPKCKKGKKKDKKKEEEGKKETESKKEEEKPYCEDLDTCEQIGAGVTPESETKVNGKISLRVAHSESDEDELAYGVTDILQYNTSARLAGCHQKPGEGGLEGPGDSGFVVSKSESSEGYKLLGANFTNALIKESKKRCKKKNRDNCDTMTTDVEISYESIDGKPATDDEKENMMKLLRQVVEEQENAGVFDSIAANVEVIDYDVDGDSLTSTSNGVRGTTGGCSFALLTCVVISGLLQILELPL